MGHNFVKKSTNRFSSFYCDLQSDHGGVVYGIVVDADGPTSRRLVNSPTGNYAMIVTNHL